MRNLHLTQPKFSYLPSTLWPLHLRNADADAARYLGVIIWNAAFGWLEKAEAPRCRFYVDIGVPPKYECELDCDHDGPHVYGGGLYRWYSREMPGWEGGNREINQSLGMG